MALSVSEVMLFFTAIKYIPLADATTCYLAAPIFVMAFSAIFLASTSAGGVGPLSSSASSAC